MSDDIGAASYAHLLGGNGIAGRCIRRGLIAHSKNYDSFIELLYEDLDSIIEDFQSNPQRRHADSEDRLTEEMVGNLNTAGYTASHGTAAGGHVDFTVMLGGKDLTWIGEAKKDQKFDEGFLQLSTRYRPAGGNLSHNQAGMVLYCCKPPNLTQRRTTWMEKVLGMPQFEKLSAYDCPKNKFFFYTTHTHELTGQAFIVRHMFVGLIWEPKDASALAVKARAEAKAAKPKSPKTKALKAAAKKTSTIKDAAPKKTAAASTRGKKDS